MDETVLEKQSQTNCQVWRSRRFVLSSRNLAYFDLVDEKCKSHLGLIALETVESVECDETKVHVKLGKTVFIVRASTVDEARAWALALNQNVKARHFEKDPDPHTCISFSSSKPFLNEIVRGIDATVLGLFHQLQESKDRNLELQKQLHLMERMKTSGSESRNAGMRICKAEAGAELIGSRDDELLGSLSLAEETISRLEKEKSQLKLECDQYAKKLKEKENRLNTSVPVQAIPGARPTESTPAKNQPQSGLQQISKSQSLPQSGLDSASHALALSKGSPPVDPQPVFSHWKLWQFFRATINHFKAETHTFVVDFADGDPTNREQPFDLVYPDQVPGPDEVAVGSLVLFRQGQYHSTAAHNGGWFRHQGVVTGSCKGPDGRQLFSGHHTKGEADGKRILRSYAYEFHDVPLEGLRVAGNILDLLAAF